jgi:hypothetical protein
VLVSGVPNVVGNEVETIDGIDIVNIRNAAHARTSRSYREWAHTGTVRIEGRWRAARGVFALCSGIGVSLGLPARRARRVTAMDAARSGQYQRSEGGAAVARACQRQPAPVGEIGLRSRPLAWQHSGTDP